MRHLSGSSRQVLLAAALAALLGLSGGNVSAQGTNNAAEQPPSTATPTPTPDGKQTSDTADAPAKKNKRGSFIVAPIPIISPALGSGLVLGVGYVFKLNQNDKTSPPSSIGLAGAFTRNGSRGGGIGAHLYFGENKYQTRFVFAKGRVNYDFYGIGRSPGQNLEPVEIRQSGSVIFGEFMRNLGKDVFIGPRYQYRKLAASLGGVTTPGGFVIPDIDLRSTTAALGFRTLRDTTRGSFYPREGSILSFTGDFFAKPLGSNRTYQTYNLFYNGYKSVGEKDVIAYRGRLCQVSDKAPFFDLCLFGTSSDLRGYTAGEFQDRRMFATQFEYRRELPYRLGLVGFAGIGGVAPEWDKFHKLLPAAGVGLRFKLDKTNHINYRIDVGWGRSGRTLSISVGEAF